MSKYLAIVTSKEAGFWPFELRRDAVSQEEATEWFQGTIAHLKSKFAIPYDSAIEVLEIPEYLEDLVQQLLRDAKLRESDSFTIECVEGDSAIVKVRSGRNLQIFLQDETLENLKLVHSQLI